jgi:hypothetical protein
MSKKFKFELEGIMFELPIKFLKKVDWNGNPLKKPIINMNHVASANVVKQFVKKKYPNVVVSSSSSSFANGNSVDIYLSDEYGNGVDESIVKDVHQFGNQFVYGKFNGMIDLYEYTNYDGKTDNGTELSSGTKYLHVQNRPKFCSLPDIVRMIKDMMTGEYVYGPISLEKAIENVKDYGATNANVEKALQLI